MRQCDGNGGTVDVPDDTDLPNDGNACTIDSCSAGTPTFTNQPSGTLCGTGSVCDGQGVCVGCVDVSDCPGQDSACGMRTCIGGTCGTNNTAAGTPLPTASQTTGDCKVLQCDGSGGTVTADDDGDVPVDGNPCTNDVCSSGVPSNPPLAAGVACAQGSGIECDGAGACVQCLTALECPGQDAACQVRTCTTGVCGFGFLAAGTPLPAASQAAGDCKVLQCDGSGGTATAVDATDVPVDGNACTGDVCTNGVPSNPNLPVGTACAQNGGEVCDPTATCNRLLAYVQFGDGIAARNATSASVFIDYVYANGTPGKAATAMPTTAVGLNAPFTNSGSATSEGYLSRSIDTHFVTLVGYATGLGVANVNTTTSTATNRVVARVDAAGTIDTTTLLSGSFSGNNPRSAVTIDGSSFWVAGAGGNANGGVWYATLGPTGSVMQITGQSGTNPPNNVRILGIFGDALYGSAMSTPFNGAFSIGGSPPPTASATAMNTMTGLTASGTGTASAYGFVLFDLDATITGVDTLYLADDRATASGGGIQKWLLGAGGTWTLAATFNQGLTAGCRGLTGWVSGSNVVLAATTADSTAKLVIVTDNGSTAPAFTTLATALPMTTFRGVALAPR